MVSIITVVSLGGINYVLLLSRPLSSIFQNLNPSNMPSFDRCCRAWVCCGEENETLKMIGCDRGDDQTSKMILLLGVDGQEQLIEASLLNAGRANYARCTSREMYHEGKLTDFWR